MQLLCENSNQSCPLAVANHVSCLGVRGALPPLGAHNRDSFADFGEQAADHNVVIGRHDRHQRRRRQANRWFDLIVRSPLGFWAWFCLIWWYRINLGLLTWGWKSLCMGSKISIQVCIWSVSSFRDRYRSKCDPYLGLYAAVSAQTWTGPTVASGDTLGTSV